MNLWTNKLFQMKKLLQILFNVKPAESVGLTYVSRREPMVVTPEFEAWCKNLNVSCLAPKQSTNVEIVMGNTIKIVDFQSIF